MNDNDRTLDEIASAYLDGEATPAERALVTDDRDLQRRVAELTEVRDLAATVPPLPTADVIDAQVERALAASRTAPNVTSITTPRSRRQRWYRSPAALSAAAVVVFGIIALAALNDGTSDSDSVATGDADQSAADPGATGDEGGVVAAEELSAEPPGDGDADARRGSDDGGDGSASGGADLADTAAAGPAAALGAFGTVEELLDAIDAGDEFSPSTSGTDVHDDAFSFIEPDCLNRAQELLDEAGFSYASAILVDEPVDLVIGQTAVVIIETPDCSATRVLLP